MSSIQICVLSISLSREETPKAMYMAGAVVFVIEPCAASFIRAQRTLRSSSTLISLEASFSFVPHLVIVVVVLYIRLCTHNLTAATALCDAAAVDRLAAATTQAHVGVHGLLAGLLTELLLEKRERERRRCGGGVGGERILLRRRGVG